MFLNEVALGKENHIFQDNPNLTRPPNGFDCVVARGHTEPDPAKDAKIKLDGKDVIVPQGKPINMGIQSYFSQSEYLIYQESQCRIRYLLQLKF
jgi:poly [ADP-ribose] polymerase